MEENRDLHIDWGWIRIFSDLSHKSQPWISQVYKKYSIDKILGNSHQKCRENSQDELKLMK